MVVALLLLLAGTQNAFAELPADYQTLKAQDKLEILWKKSCLLE